jgi:hypothetical protein
VIYWIYTSLIFLWAALHHFSISNASESQEKLRIPLIVTNIAVMIMIFIFFISFVSTGLDKYQVALAGSITLAIANTITGILLLLYGLLLAKTLESNASLTDAPAKCFDFDYLPFRMRALAIAVSTCFFIESIMWILSVAEWKRERTSDATVYTAVFLTFDVLALCCMLLVFNKAIKKLEVGTTKKSSAASVMESSKRMNNSERDIELSTNFSQPPPSPRHQTSSSPTSPTSPTSD